ncbi:hypothetical protein [Nonlabens xiamenensis]|uniref:hypothetical protein n=1 Tax=Nonlabens xiamenensis TaxID=2341043 RepID=UPI001F0C0823|nr:hypothetical protein [Nonlabens xiamenensis]
MKRIVRLFSISTTLAIMGCLLSCQAQQLPAILSKKSVQEQHYLPDFSYAGYHNGERAIPSNFATIIQAEDYGVLANDGLDDSINLKKAIQAAYEVEGPVCLQLPAGRLILSDIIYLERSNFVLRGAGTDAQGTEIYFPRPLMYEPDPEALQELREYLVKFDKVQREKDNNISLPFSQYAWSGGFIWTQVPGERVKSYLKEYERPIHELTAVGSGNRGEKTIQVEDASNLSLGDVLELQLFNKEGEQGQIISELYKDTNVKIGSHHWNFPDLPIVRQQVEIKKIQGNTVTLNTPLTISIRAFHKARLVEWKHLEEVGIENFRISFPMTPRVAHHVEQGWNGINLTRLYNSWVKDIVIDNADSGVLSEEIANVTIKNITTTGDHYAHYTVAMAGVHNVLAENIVVQNKAEHPLSFNTFSTKNVYKDCEVLVDPILDQHSGANHQNLFDNVKVHLPENLEDSYPLFAGGGAGYWKPSHGAYSTFWNTQVILPETVMAQKTFTLNGMKDGPLARVIGTHGNGNYQIEYGPDAYISHTNQALNAAPSLYTYQLEQRMKNMVKE